MDGPPPAGPSLHLLPPLPLSSSAETLWSDRSRASILASSACTSPLLPISSPATSPPLAERPRASTASALHPPPSSADPRTEPSRDRAIAPPPAQLPLPRVGHSLANAHTTASGSGMPLHGGPSDAAAPLVPPAGGATPSVAAASSADAADGLAQPSFVFLRVEVVRWSLDVLLPAFSADMTGVTGGASYWVTAHVRDGDLEHVASFVHGASYDPRSGSHSLLNSREDYTLQLTDAVRPRAAFLLLLLHARRDTDDVATVGRANVPWGQVCSNFAEETREVELGDEGGDPIGVLLSVTVWTADFASSSREEQALHEAVARMRLSADLLAVEAVERRARVEVERRLLAEEMEADVAIEAAARVEPVLREMREQIEAAVEQERVVGGEEAKAGDETSEATRKLRDARDASMQMLDVEASFYPQHAEETHSRLREDEKRARDRMVASLQQTHLRALHEYRGHSVQLVDAIERRLHQAVDYQSVLVHEAVERHAASCAAWVEIPSQLLRAELQHAAARWANVQRALQAEVLSGTAVLHGSLVEVQGRHDAVLSEATSRHSRLEEALAAVPVAFFDSLRREAAAVVERASGEAMALEDDMRGVLRTVEEMGDERGQSLHRALERMHALVGDVEAGVADEVILAEALVLKESVSRLQQLEASYQRRVSRVRDAAAEKDEERARLESLAAEAEARLSQLTARFEVQMGSVTQLSRGMSGGRHEEHMELLRQLHSEFEHRSREEEGRYDSHLAALKEERGMLTVAEASERLAVSYAHAEGAVATISALRREAVEAQLQMGTRLLVMHLERVRQQAEAAEQRLRQEFRGAMAATRLHHSRASMRLIADMQRKRNDEQLVFKQAGVHALQLSWSREKPLYKAHVERIADARAHHVAMLVRHAQEQVGEQYASLAALRAKWAEMARVEVVEGKARVALDDDVAWLATQLQATASTTEARAQADVRLAEQVAAECLSEWGAQLERGARADAQLFGAAADRRHAAPPPRDAEVDASLLRLNERCAAALSGREAHRAAVAARAAEAEKAERRLAVHAAEAAEKAAEKAEGVSTRTSGSLRSVSARLSEQLEQLSYECEQMVDSASAANAESLEREVQLRRARFLDGIETDLRQRAAQLAETRDVILRNIRGELRTQRDAEEGLCAQVSRQIASASETHGRALETERRRMEAACARLAGEDRARYEEAAHAAVAWQRAAHERFGSVLFTPWRRGLTARAQAALEAQRGRRDAFGAARAARRDAAVAAARRRIEGVRRTIEALREVAAPLGAPAQLPRAVGAIAQQLLDRVCDESAARLGGELREAYEAAWAHEKEAAGTVARFVRLAAAETEKLLHALLKEGATPLAPPGGPFVREALIQALGGREALARVREAQAAQLAQEEAQDLRTNGAAVQLARARLRERREAAAAAAAERMAREATARRQEEQEEFRRLEAEAGGEASLAPAQARAVGEARAALAQLEWDARQMAAERAARVREEAAHAAHERALAREARREAELRSRLESSAAREGEELAAARAALEAEAEFKRRVEQMEGRFRQEWTERQRGEEAQQLEVVHAKAHALEQQLEQLVSSLSAEAAHELVRGISTSLRAARDAKQFAGMQKAAEQLEMLATIAKRSRLTLPSGELSDAGLADALDEAIQCINEVEVEAEGFPIKVPGLSSASAVPSTAKGREGVVPKRVKTTPPARICSNPKSRAQEQPLAQVAAANNKSGKSRKLQGNGAARRSPNQAAGQGRREAHKCGRQSTDLS